MNLYHVRILVGGVLGLAVSSLVMPGCGPDGDAGSRAEPGGRYERIVGMSPSIAEILFALGQSDRVVGVSDYTAYPPEAEALPRCGGYLNPNFEVILSLRPDLIVTHGHPGEFRRFGERYGIEVFPAEFDDLESVVAAIHAIGRALDCRDEAQELAGRMQAQLSAIGAAARDAGRPPRTLLVVGRDPSSLREVHVVGPGGFLHDLLELAGGDNVMADLGRQYSSVSKEIIAQRRPEVIIELHGEGMMGEEERRRYLQVWRDMVTLPAVKDGRIYVIEETFAMLPGPRSVRIAERMADLLHGIRPAQTDAD